MGKRIVVRALLVLIGVACLWDSTSRSWWWKCFKNGGF